MGSNMIKVSICIPCYNAEQWIEENINSALQQDGIKVEVIVIDDGSTDNSLEIIKSFGTQIIWETGPNHGGNAARNQALSLSSGEWVQFLDGDDYLEQNKIANQLRNLKQSSINADVIYSPVKNEQWSDKQKKYYISSVDTSDSLEEQWIKWQVAQTRALLWKRSSLNLIGGWNEDMSCCQDNEITMRAIIRGLKFHFSPKV